MVSLEIEKSENVVYNNLNKILLYSFFLVLIIYLVNARHLEKLLSYEIRDLDLKNSKQEKVLKRNKAFRDMMIKNSKFVGQRLPLLEKYSWKSGRIMIAAVMRSGDERNKLRMQYIITNRLKNETKNTPIIYVSDNDAGNRYYNEYDFQIGDKDILSELPTPVLFVVGDNRRVLQVYEILGNEDLETLNFVKDMILTVIHNGKK